MNPAPGHPVRMKLQKPACAYCAMPAEFACDMPDCLVPMCRKHINNRQVDGRDLCRKHRQVTTNIDKRRVLSLS